MTTATSSPSSDLATHQKIGLVLGPIAALATLTLFSPDGLPDAGVHTAAIALLMAVWWATEAIPVAVTAFLPMVLFPFFGVIGRLFGGSLGGAGGRGLVRACRSALFRTGGSNRLGADCSCFDDLFDWLAIGRASSTSTSINSRATRTIGSRRGSTRSLGLWLRTISARPFDFFFRSDAATNSLISGG